ncbi:hypothetical protein D3C72_1517080 [compost metagenome]
MERPAQLVQGQMGEARLEVEGFLEWQGVADHRLVQQIVTGPLQQAGTQAQGLVVRQQPETAQVIVILLVAQAHGAHQPVGIAHHEDPLGQIRHIVGECRLVVVPDQGEIRIAVLFETELHCPPACHTHFTLGPAALSFPFIIRARPT